MPSVRAAALVYAALIAGVVLFQAALAAGAPWGAYAMGGASPGVFPPPCARRRWRRPSCWRAWRR